MARDLVPRLTALCQHEGATLSIEFKRIKGYYHNCHDIYNLIKRNIEINNNLKNFWQSWQSHARSKFWLMGITLNKFYMAVRPPKYGVLYV